MHASSARVALVSAASIVAATLAFLVAPAASATTPSPAVPSQVALTKVTSTSFTVRVRSAHAHKFVLYTSTNKPDLYAANIEAGRHSTARRSVTSSRATLTLGGLRYSAATRYYRVVVFNGPHRRFGPTIYPLGLQPAAPTALRATSTAAGTRLSWAAGAVTGYRIVAAADRALKTGRHTYTVRGQLHAFTPFGLPEGRTAYFAVSGLNNGTVGPASPVAGVVVRHAETGLRVLTYNVLEATADGQPLGGQTIAPWSARRPVAAALIRSSGAGLVAIQEAAAWTGAVGGQRQIDSLAAALDGTYALARTEIPPTEPHYRRMANYILYKPSLYAPVGAGDHWSLGDSTTAAYQVFRNRSTGAELLFVSPHLIVGAGATYDAERQNEARSLLRQAGAVAAAAGVPVVYAGDFNSNTSKVGHAFDGPSLAMASAQVANARNVAQVRANEQYNSANRYLRAAPKDGLDIDYVFTTQGVGVTGWGMILRLSNGRFVGTMASDHNPVYADLRLPY